MVKYIILTMLALYATFAYAQTDSIAGNISSRRPFLRAEGKASYFFGLTRSQYRRYLFSADIIQSARTAAT